MVPHDEAMLTSTAPLAKTAAVASVARLLKQVLPPFICFVLSRALLHTAAISTQNDPFEADTWSRWDSYQYISIAATGYGFRSCAGLDGYDPNDWCGNDAWLPGYSYLIKAVTAVTSLTYAEAGISISAAFAFASLLLVWIGFLGATVTPHNVLVLLLAAFFPGHVYDHAVFPIALFTFLVLLSLWLYSRRDFRLAGLCAAAAAFSYSSGLFLCGAFVLQAFVGARGRLREMPLRTLAFPCGGVLLGFSLALLLQWVQTGVWNAFFLVQSKYAYSPRLPFEAWQSSLLLLLTHWPNPDGADAQTIFVAAMCMLMFVYFIKRQSVKRLDVLLMSFTLIYWLVPITLGGKLSLYRAEATLLPGVPLARRVPWPILAALVCIAIRLSWKMARAFFAGRIM